MWVCLQIISAMNILIKNIARKSPISLLISEIKPLKITMTISPIKDTETAPNIARNNFNHILGFCFSSSTIKLFKIIIFRQAKSMKQPTAQATTCCPRIYPTHNSFYANNQANCCLRLFSNALISFACCNVKPISSKPFNKQCLRCSVMSNENTSPLGVVTV